MTINPWREYSFERFCISKIHDESKSFANKRIRLDNAPIWVGTLQWQKVEKQFNEFCGFVRVSS